MKVYLVWYSDPYNPIYDVVKVFDNNDKAEKYIELQDDKNDLYIEEHDVE